MSPTAVTYYSVMNTSKLSVLERIVHYFLYYHNVAKDLGLTLCANIVRTSSFMFTSSSSSSTHIDF